ncbi:MAG: pseudouridine synthase [Bacteroidota bacterium]
MQLEIIFQDEYLIAINKPAGLLVHRTPMARDATEFALQLLRDQVGQKVYPAHRLDRKTSGVLVFSFSETIDRQLKSFFSERKTQKVYHAVVRGFSPDEIIIDHPIKNEKGMVKKALTHWKTLEQYEIDVPLGKHQTSRYSFVEMSPETGRFHQLRKHAAHIYHPIIGDRPHGCNKQNRLWKNRWGMTRMLLHASKLTIPHPVHNQPITLEAGFDEVYKKVVAALRNADTTKLNFFITADSSVNQPPA